MSGSLPVDSEQKADLNSEAESTFLTGGSQQLKHLPEGPGLQKEPGDARRAPLTWFNRPGQKPLSS